VSIAWLLGTRERRSGSRRAAVESLVGNQILCDRLDVGSCLIKGDLFQEEVFVFSGGLQPVTGVAGATVVSGQRRCQLPIEGLQLLREIGGAEENADGGPEEVLV